MQTKWLPTIGGPGLGAISWAFGLAPQIGEKGSQKHGCVSFGEVGLRVKPQGTLPASRPGPGNNARRAASPCARTTFVRAARMQGVFGCSLEDGFSIRPGSRDGFQSALL